MANPRERCTTARSIPLDVLREIFEFTGFSDTCAGVQLTGVSKPTRAWLFPRIYHVMLLDNVALRRLNHAAFAHASHVRRIIVLGSAPPDEEYEMHGWPSAFLLRAELHVIAGGLGDAPRGRITRLYIDSGTLGAASLTTFITRWSWEFACSHFGLRVFAEHRAPILAIVRALLRPRHESLPQLCVISLRVTACESDVKNTGLWKALRELRDPRIRVGRVPEDAPLSRPWHAREEVQLRRAQDIYRAYVTGEEDPWSFGEVVWPRDEVES